MGAPESFTATTDITHWIGGQRVPATGGRTQAVYNPATGAVARQLQLASREDVAAAVATFVIAHNQCPHFGVFALNPWQRMHKAVEAAQAFEIAVHEGDRGYRAIDADGAHLVADIWIWAGHLCVDALVNHMQA